MMLCDLCKEVRPPHSGEGFGEDHVCLLQHHPNFDALLRSASAGCAMCTAFRPFVEYCRRKRLGQPVFDKSSEDDESVYSVDERHPQDDPFDNEDVSDPNDIDDEMEILSRKWAEPAIIQTSKTTYYEDEGRRYYWVDESLDGRNNLLQESHHRTLEREEAEDRAAGLLGQHKDSTDDYEIVQWLCKQEGKRLDSEQMWISARTFHGGEDDLKGHREVSPVIILSAGSVEMADLGSSFCLNGRMVGNKHRLRLEVPSLYKWPLDELKMRRQPSCQPIQPTFEFYQHREGVKTSSRPVTSRSIPPDPSSRLCWSLMKEWKSTCEKFHKGCRRQDGGKAPTRLVDVGVLDASRRPRLQVSDSDSAKRYATLSHCWAGALQVVSVLQAGNIEQMKRGINMAAMPQTFQDAVRITQELNIPYLWIDCLCVVQDSVDDWARESPHMARYYEGGEIMLSALASSSSSQGMLRRRAVDDDAVTVSLDSHELGFRLALEDVTGAVKPDTYSDVRPRMTQQPLNTRGWTLQERLFAPRVIHFTQQ